MVTREEFADLALALPEATPGSHFGQPDFRVHGKIFCGLERAGDRAGQARRPALEQPERRRRPRHHGEPDSACRRAARQQKVEAETDARARNTDPGTVEEAGSRGAREKDPKKEVDPGLTGKVILGA
jgi:hypothetical protein